MRSSAQDARVAPADAMRIARFRTFVSIAVFALGLFWAMSYERQRFEVTNVTLDEGRALIDRGALIVDVRSEEAYRKGHLPGAISAPIRTLREGAPPLLAGATDRDVLVYCADGATTGPEGTQLLNRAGFARAVNLKPGIEAWQAAGQPVVR